MTRPFCAICTNLGPELRPRQFSAGGPVFIICRRCDESEPTTIRSRPAVHRAPRGSRHRHYIAFDELANDLAFRILRTVQRFDWVSSMEITDALGIPVSAADPREHNRFSVSLSRLFRKGYLRRRDILEWCEYQITQRGLARIETSERSVVENKRSIAA